MSILIIDGSEDDLELIVYTLRTSAVLNDVRVARDGQAALDFLHGSSFVGSAPEDRPQLIPLDLDRRDISGLDLLRAIKTNPQSSNVPLIVFATSLSDCDVVGAFDLGSGLCSEAGELHRLPGDRGLLCPHRVRHARSTADAADVAAA